MCPRLISLYVYLSRSDEALVDDSNAMLDFKQSHRVYPPPKEAKQAFRGREPAHEKPY
jgi:hypothetical protein